MVHYILALLFFVFGFVFLLASGTPHQEIDTFIIFEVGAIASVWYDISYLNMRDAKDWTTVYIYEDKMVSYSSSFSKLVIKKLCEVDLGKTIYYEELNISGMAWDDYFEMFVISNEPIGLPSNRGKKYRFRNDYDKSKQILINTSTYIYRNRNKWIKQCEKPIWL
jgi:hypothetical protein